MSLHTHQIKFDHHGNEKGKKTLEGVGRSTVIAALAQGLKVPYIIMKCMLTQDVGMGNVASLGSDQHPSIGADVGEVDEQTCGQLRNLIIRNRVVPLLHIQEQVYQSLLDVDGYLTRWNSKLH